MRVTDWCVCVLTTLWLSCAGDCVLWCVCCVVFVACCVMIAELCVLYVVC